MLKQLSIVAVGFAGLASIGLVDAHAAPSHCVGLDQKVCTTTDKCTWRDAAKRKDGKTIKAHCRLSTRKPQQQATTRASSSS